MSRLELQIGSMTYDETQDFKELVEEETKGNDVDEDEIVVGPQDFERQPDHSLAEP